MISSMHATDGNILFRFLIWDNRLGSSRIIKHINTYTITIISVNDSEILLTREAWFETERGDWIVCMCGWMNENISISYTSGMVLGCSNGEDELIMIRNMQFIDGWIFLQFIIYILWQMTV